MAEIKRLAERIKRLNGGNAFIAVLTDGEGCIQLNYYISGNIRVQGVLYFSEIEQAYDKMIEIIEKYRVFRENCYIYEILGADELE